MTQQARGFLAGQPDEAANGQPVEGVERLAELPALADPRREADAEFFDADAGEFGGDEVSEFVQDDQSEQDADEGEDGVEQDHGFSVLAKVERTDRGRGARFQARAGNDGVRQGLFTYG